MGNIANIADVARLAGVSPTQVSFVINQKNLDRVSQERQFRIKSAIRELDYIPNMAARQLAGKRTHLLGVIMHSLVAQVNYARLRSIDEQAMKLGYQVLVSRDIGSPMIRQAKAPPISAYNLDGLICITHAPHRDPSSAHWQLQHSPHVVYFERPQIQDACYVQIDIADASRQCVEHLLSTGRKRLSLCLPEKGQAHNTIRLQGYTQALRAAGIEVDEKLIYMPDTTTCNQMLGVKQAQEILDQVVDSAGSDGIIAFNDFWAARLVQSLLSRGKRVPQDVAVIGQSNLEFAELMTPAITTIDERCDKVGKHLVNMLVDKIEGREASNGQRQFTIKTNLIIRETT